MIISPHPPVFGRQAAQLRRRLGPVAWCALECLAERADGRPAGGVVEASVRAIAVDLAVAKNTAHRAIATLVRAGLVSPTQARDGAGRFRAGHYQLHLEHLAASPKPRRPHPTPTTTTTEPTQLTLLQP